MLEIFQGNLSKNEKEKTIQLENIIQQAYIFSQP